MMGQKALGVRGFGRVRDIGIVAPLHQATGSNARSVLGLLTTASGSVAILLVSLFSPTFLPFLCAMCVFFFRMAIVSPLGTAQALSPFGEKAGASALLGFWQMMNAAVGVWLAAAVSHDAMFALGVVLTIFSVAALSLYRLKPGLD
jgi:MFS transporter, DHA1 family, multidrug resistance protein